MTVLKGITWDHSRGFTSVVATAQRFHELHPHIEIIWEKRSLQAFADERLDELAERFDLLVIDHPWAGTINRGKWLVPLNEHLPATFLEDQAAHSVGQSHKSYEYEGQQWALAIDAACPVSAYRKDLLEKAGEAFPVTWDDVLKLARKGLVTCPSIPLDVYGNFLNILVSSGKAVFPDEAQVACREDGLYALELLKEFHSHIPKKFFELNPIRALEHMSQTDEAAYMPFTYGYSNYSRKHYYAKHINFGSAPQLVPGTVGSTMLGGTGIAISAHCNNVEAAAMYLAFTASPKIQAGLYYEAGGQPGYRAAWECDAINATCDNYFRDTLPALDAAFVRPRYAGYLDFQDVAGTPIHNYLKDGGDAHNVLDTLDKLYQENRKKNL